ncbi:MAG: YHYH protein [Alcanivoracaceae bacterium]|nr:YHYH protein [Alcanivoracaceae bacterium]
MMEMPRLIRLSMPLVLALTSACGGGNNNASPETTYGFLPHLCLDGHLLQPDTSLSGSSVSITITSLPPDILVSGSGGSTINFYSEGVRARRDGINLSIGDSVEGDGLFVDPVAIPGPGLLCGGDPTTAAEPDPEPQPAPQHFEPGMFSWQYGDLTLSNGEHSFTFHVIDLVPAEDAPRIPLSANRIDGILMRESVGIEGLILMRLPDCDETRDCSQWHLNPRHEPSWYGLDELFSHGNDHLDSHYHGLSDSLFEDTIGELRQVGMAADGYPIASGWFDDNGMMRRATSSYQLKTGHREQGAGFSEPSGPYNGEYVEDYEYVPGSGDLDQCNAMVVNGIYTYFMTPEFPYLMNCLRGVPHDSFLISAP